MPQDQWDTQKAQCTYPQAVHKLTATKPHHAVRHQEVDNSNGETLQCSQRDLLRSNWTRIKLGWPITAVPVRVSIL